VVIKALSLTLLKGLGFASTARKSRLHSSCDSALTSPGLILGNGISAAGLSLSKPARWAYLKKDLMAASVRARVDGPLGLLWPTSANQSGNPERVRGLHLLAGTSVPDVGLGKSEISASPLRRTL